MVGDGDKGQVRDKDKGKGIGCSRFGLEKWDRDIGLGKGEIWITDEDFQGQGNAHIREI